MSSSIQSPDPVKGVEAPLSSQTPMLRQYLEIKQEYADAILFYRIGDFYEMFFDDAVKASKVLDIVLTSRNKNDPNPVPLCGIPYHSMEPYLEKLVRQGYKVAICDQVEDPKEAKGIVRREVTRVITPGLAGCLDGIEGEVGGGALAAVVPGDGMWGLAKLDIATGDFRVTEIAGDWKKVFEEIRRLAPKEILVPESWDDTAMNLRSFICLTTFPHWMDDLHARKILSEQFRVVTLSGFGCEEMTAGLVAAGALLHYTREMQKVKRLTHVTAIKRYTLTESMFIGEESRKNLSLDELVDCIDRTKTAPGRRKLHAWYEEPLLSLDKIRERQEAVGEFKERIQLLDIIQKHLTEIYDVERIGSRLSLGTANARDLKALRQTLDGMRHLAPLLTELQSPILKKLSLEWKIFRELRDEIDTTLVEDPPLALKEGGLVREGIHPELDEYRSLQRDAKATLAAIEDRERRRTGINSLKIHFNRVFGYYIEVSVTNLSKVPPDFIRKQTLANAERYITEELKILEGKILGADERIKALEYDVFCRLRDKALETVPELQAQTDRVSRLDVLVSFSTYAREARCICPVIDDSGVLEIKGGRHPLAEKNLPPGTYVPTDLRVDANGERLLMITGPNMAGKSTAIRQAGILALMAQTGSFVPAESFRLGLIDQIFTRVGASDRLARGESTFMVEMCEMANILHHATRRSFILLDEIGRGTATFDGISIAWAVAEHLHDKVQARTLFATHYHELVDLALTKPGIKNYNVEVREIGAEIVFLYRLVPGGMSHSYGIHVARLAGLPEAVVERAKEVLQNLEQDKLDPAGSPRLSKKRKKDDGQMPLL